MDDESFRARPPPIHPDDDLGSLPGSILLDVLGYISFRTNATTAEGLSTTKKRINVTFWAAHPPRASCFTVYSPDVELSTELTDAPQIINTEDDLVLLRVPIPRPHGIFHNNYFVYQAGTENKGPSLDLVTAPLPESYFISDHKLGLLHCRDRDMYFVAILSRAAFTEYNLHLYSSETGKWSTKLMTCLDSRHKSYISSVKVITIGGKLGSVGWVDLWRGILICDVLLLDNRKLRYIPLPSPAVPRPYWLPTAVASGVVCRDIIVLEGLIKYFEMFVSPKGGGGWEAVEWRRGDSGKEWTKHHVIKVSVDLEAEIKEQPTLKLKTFSGFPALSLHDAGVVYITDRHGYTDKKLLVVAVDMRKQTLKDKADYVRRGPLDCSFYCGSRISKHLRWTSLDHSLYCGSGISKHLRWTSSPRLAPLVGQSVGDDMDKLEEDNEPIHIKMGYPPLPKEPHEPPEGSHICKVEIRLPNGRRIRRNFWHTDPIKLLWSFSYPEVEDGYKRVFHFVHIIPGKCRHLDVESDLTFKDAQIANSTLNFLWD